MRRKWNTIVIRKIPAWYVLFSAAFCLFVAMLSGNLQPWYTNNFLHTGLQPISQGNTAEPKVALACNVFWGEEFLPQMLDTLAQQDAKITFFIGGSWAKKYPEMVKTIADGGHELGNHTYSHPHPNNLSKEKNQEQIIKTEELVHSITGIKTNLYAPPYGEYNNTVLMAAHELDYRTIMWSIDTIDWKRPPAQVIKNRVISKLHNGAIILMHPTAPTAEALPELLREIKNKGYTVVKVSDILQ